MTDANSNEMEFCPDCKSIMVPIEGRMVCRKCGRSIDMAKNSFVSKSKQIVRDIPVLEEEEEAGLPTTKARCSECGNDTAYWWLRQLRSADESEVRFFRCTKCNNTWREYH
jgi:DNA-directed RNA polymerase subunit M